MTPFQECGERVRLHPLVQTYAGQRFDAWDADARTTAREAVAAWYVRYVHAIPDGDIEPDKPQQHRRAGNRRGTGR
jgi:hypothetical protein